MQLGDFFLVVSPAFNSLALAELQLKQKEIEALCKNFKLVSGPFEWSISHSDEGITISGLPLEVGFSLNLFLKIPTRILLRLKSFRCRDFPKLFKQTQKINWMQFTDGTMPQVKASASKSRLMILKRIEKTVSDGLRKYFTNQGGCDGSPKESGLTVSVRFYDDTCTLSADTSGLALYKRHSQKKVGQAPIRETVAAALLSKLFEHDTYSLEKKFTLVDPMVRSGTFLMEAKSFGLVTKRQEYAFLDFPCMDDKKEQFLNLQGAQLNASFGDFDCLGYDRNQAMLTSAKENLLDYHGVALKHQDIMADMQHQAPESAVLICNPPYGKRIGFDDKPSSFFNKLLAMIYDKWKPYLSGVIVPEEIFKDKAFKIPNQFKVLEAFKFLNGGVKVRLLILSLAEK